MGASVPPVNVRFQASGVPEVDAAFKRVTSSSQTFSRSFVEANGRVSAFGRQSVQTFNAIGFAASTLTTGGKVGFKELASSAAGFASFFGPAGLIASGVISLGLILTSFWTKQRKEIEDTKKKAEQEFQSLKAGMEREADTRARAQDPVRFAREELARLQRRTNENVAKIAAIDADPEGRVGTPIATPIARRRITAARADARKQLQDEIIADAKSIEEANRKLSEAIQKKAAELTAKATPAIKENTRATGASGDAAKDAERALEAEIDALVQLGKQNMLSVADLTRLIQLQQQYTAAVRAGTLSLLERAEASRKLSQIESGIVIPPLEVTPITETRTQRAPGPAATLPPVNIPPATVEAATQPVGVAVGDAFAMSMASGIANGMGQLIAGGSIESAFATFGQSIVSAVSLVNPYLGIAAGFLTSMLGGLFGGGPKRPRAPELPIEIRRVITDPSFRQPVKAASMPGGRPLYVNTPRGSRELRAWTGMAAARGIP